MFQLPEVEEFDVELVKDNLGLGVTIAGYVSAKSDIGESHWQPSNLHFVELKDLELVSDITYII